MLDSNTIRVSVVEQSVTHMVTMVSSTCRKKHHRLDMCWLGVEPAHSLADL